YLGSARQRISVRRLARLVDYQMHDGASARTFINFQLAAGTTGFAPAGSQILTRINVPVDEKLPQHGPSFSAADADAARTATDTWKLRPGDLLLFEEVLGPVTGLAADADPKHRQVVRLTAVETATDALEPDPVTHLRPTALTKLSWAPQDALMFPLCLSVMLADNALISGVSVARGNLVLADH